MFNSPNKAVGHCIRFFCQGSAVKRKALCDYVRQCDELTGALLEDHAAHELEEPVGVEAWPVD